MAPSLRISSNPFIVTNTTVSCIFSFLILLAMAVKAQDGFDFGPEKRTHLHFFFHDILSGPNPTAVPVARGPSKSSTVGGFGDLVMVDDPLTEGSDPGSRLIGRAQGFYAGASQEETALLMAMNYHFLDGDYSGSTLAILGRNNVGLETREMAVVGGTGNFRLARGYAVARTHTLDPATGDAVVEYDVYVIHQGAGSGGPSSARRDASRASSAGSPSVVPLPLLLLLLQALFHLFYFYRPLQSAFDLCMFEFDIASRDHINVD